MSIEAQSQLPRFHKLPEVAAQTGIPLKYLQAGCRAERIRHCNFNGHRRMTDEHVAELIAAYEVGVTQNMPAGPDDADRARVEQMFATATT
jgi:hypothetical protein